MHVGNGIHKTYIWGVVFLHNASHETCQLNILADDWDDVISTSEAVMRIQYPGLDWERISVSRDDEIYERRG